jgi:hypothetical protein
MNQVDNERATAEELVTYARQRRLDLDALRNDFAFKMDRRWIIFWRKRADLPASGRADEQEGTLHYSMQGAISLLPGSLKASAGAFRGAWHEAGTFENLAQAVEFVKAWLIDRKEIDDLPSRSVRRYGI